ncbi:nuclear receptor coactivator 4 isoform X4 [Girardinichthys multiradiatus]|uniref:nuclear receptor coactivator 4 isoform X4 n=1 Tax=Girardinichthys multiradiatus TaxID=208333 RepID=UPI001FADB2C2|nr:nuclear receptor coactivator 4 isoform X4 [Girardinichthys multiradiatus]
MTSKSRLQSKAARMSPTEAAMSSLKLCLQAQDQLENAIGGVLMAEQQLRENAREVRSELQSCVSRQQEALRCREVWLSGQIELLEQVKTEALQQQLHQLHRLRGQFDVIAYQLQNSNSSKDLNNQLTSCMEKLTSLSLTPEETPEMSFHADTRSLRQAITSFGSITAQSEEGVSSLSPTPQRAQVQSCPLVASEQISCPVLPSMDFLKAWGQVQDLEVWLLKDQNQVSRERTSSSCSSSFSIEKIDESEFNVSSEDELSDWLITPPTVAMEISDAERWRCEMKPFEESWSPSEWLASRPATDCSSCCQTSKALEIENLGQLKCLKTPPTSGPASPTSLEAWLQQVAPLRQTCKANETCSTYADCICDDNCGKEALSHWLLQQEGRDKNGVPVTKNAPPTTFHREQEQKVQAILEAWLQPSTSSCSGDLGGPEENLKRKCSSQAQNQSSSPFQHPLNPDFWLLPDKTQRSGGLACPAEEDNDKWLLKKRSQTQDRLVFPAVCELFSCMNVGGDKDKWLHRAAVQM